MVQGRRTKGRGTVGALYLFRFCFKRDMGHFSKLPSPEPPHFSEGFAAPENGEKMRKGGQDTDKGLGIFGVTHVTNSINATC